MISGVTKGTITFLQIPLSILIIFFTVWSLGTKVESKLYTGGSFGWTGPNSNNIFNIYILMIMNNWHERNDELNNSLWDYVYLITFRY